MINLIYNTDYLNFSEALFDSLKQFNIRKIVFYDEEGNRTLSVSDAKKIYLDDLNVLIDIKNNRVDMYLISSETISKNKNIFDQIERTSQLYGKTIKYFFMGKKFTPKKVLMNFWENINRDKNMILQKNKKKWDKKMKNFLKNKFLFESNLGRKAKEKINFEITPEIKKWSSFLQKMYVYTSDIKRGEMPELDEEDFLKQAERLATNKIKASPSAKGLVKTEKYSVDPDIRKNQQLYDFYASVSQLLDSSKDFIVGNIVSRLATHYFYKINKYKTGYNENSANFSALVRFSDWIGEKVGLRKENYLKESKIMLEMEKMLVEWFNQFKFENIFLKEEYKKKKRKKIKKIEEGKKSGLKSTAVVKAGEKILTSLEKSGSPREIAFAKAISYYEKGLDTKESLVRAGLPTDEITKKEFASILKQRGIKPISAAQKREYEEKMDKYEQMYKQKEHLFPKEPVRK